MTKETRGNKSKERCPNVKEEQPQLGNRQETRSRTSLIRENQTHKDLSVNKVNSPSNRPIP